MPWLLVVGVQVQGSRLYARDEGDCSPEVEQSPSGNFQNSNALSEIWELWIEKVLPIFCYLVDQTAVFSIF